MRLSIFLKICNKKPPAFSDKRKYQQHKLWSVCSFQSMCKHTWIQISTWSGLEKAYLIKPFSFISCGHNGSLKIIRAICIAWTEYKMYLQHCLSFPNLRFFFSDIHYNTIYKPCHYTRGINFRYNCDSAFMLYVFCPLINSSGQRFKMILFIEHPHILSFHHGKSHQ